MLVSVSISAINMLEYVDDILFVC